MIIHITTVLKITQGFRMVFSEFNVRRNKWLMHYQQRIVPLHREKNLETLLLNTRPIVMQVKSSNM